MWTQKNASFRRAVSQVMTSFDEPCIKIAWLLLFAANDWTGGTFVSRIRNECQIVNEQVALIAAGSPMNTKIVEWTASLWPDEKQFSFFGGSIVRISHRVEILLHIHSGWSPMSTQSTRPSHYFHYYFRLLGAIISHSLLAAYWNKTRSRTV